MRSTEKHTCPVACTAPRSTAVVARSRSALAVTIAGILAAQLEEAGDQPLGAGDGDLAAGGHAAGEADQIGLASITAWPVSPSPIT